MHQAPPRRHPTTSSERRRRRGTVPCSMPHPTPRGRPHVVWARYTHLCRQQARRFCFSALQVIHYPQVQTASPGSSGQRWDAPVRRGLRNVSCRSSSCSPHRWKRPRRSVGRAPRGQHPVVVLGKGRDGVRTRRNCGKMQTDPEEKRLTTDEFPGQFS